jgi:hypothetical protein
MALPLTLQTEPVATAPRRAPARGRERTRLDLFPRSVALRWSLRFIFAIPYVVVVLLESRSAQLANTPNASLLAHVGSIMWYRADASWLADIYPPISTFIAALLLPEGQIALSIVGALVAGILLQKVIEIMVQRRFPVSTSIILTVALAANPLFAYTVTENLAGFIGLAFLGLGLAHMMRFVAWGNTQSGFRAGLFFMLAVLSDTTGLLYALTAAVAAPFLQVGRGDQRGARGSNVLVIVFPTIAVLGALALLGFAFLGNPLGPLADDFVGYQQRFATLGSVFTTPEGWLSIAPVISAWLISLIVRRPGAIVVSTLVFAAILVSFGFGFIAPNSAGNTFIIMMLLAIALIPAARTPLAGAVINVIALAQIVIAWWAAFDRPLMVTWMEWLAKAYGTLWH